MFAINGTLVVQVINFCLAYWIIRVLLFNKAISLIKQEDDFQTHLLERRDQILAAIEKQKNDLRQQWHQCRRECQGMVPLMPQEWHKERSDKRLHAPLLMTSEQKKQAQDSLARLISEKLSHVH